MGKQFFVTGTDTNIGKTYVCCALLEYFNLKKYKIIGAKPIAAGNDFYNGLSINQDVFELKNASNIDISYEEINFYSFDEPIAPHIAAEKSNVLIDFEVIKQKLEKLSYKSDILLVEGAGGYFVPVDNDRTIADLISYLDIPVIFVAGIKLGCLNHTILSIEAIKQNKQKIYGWIANIVEKDMLYSEENIEYLTKAIDAPCLGVLDFEKEVITKNKRNHYFNFPEFK